MSKTNIKARKIWIVDRGHYFSTLPTREAAYIERHYNGPPSALIYPAQLTPLLEPEKLIEQCRTALALCKATDGSVEGDIRAVLKSLGLLLPAKKRRGGKRGAT